MEKQLQSWTPRRPSPEIGRRLFGVAQQAARWPGRPSLWSWLTPLAACALTFLVALPGIRRPAAQLDTNTDSTYFATIMFNAAISSNAATYSLSRMDENLEWNIWPHALNSLNETARFAPLPRIDP